MLQTDRWRGAAALFLCLAACGCGKPTTGPNPTPQGSLTPGETTESLTFGGAARTYLLHVPATYTGTTAVPLVIDLHGLGSSSIVQSFTSGFREKAGQFGFLIAWPQGTANSWNGYGCCGTAHQTGVDDVGFIRSVVADIRAKGRVDATRIYVTGLSNGGVMTHRLACEAADLFSGAAPVAFPLNRAGCPAGFPARAIPVIHFHGLQDEVVAYNGNPVSFTGAIQSAPDSFAAWQAVHGCSGPPALTFFPNTDRCQVGRNCSGGAEPSLCSLTGQHVLYPTQTTLDIAAWALDFMSSGALR